MKKITTICLLTIGCRLPAFEPVMAQNNPPVTSCVVTFAASEKLPNATVTVNLYVP